jgi:hypothetical protein
LTHYSCEIKDGETVVRQTNLDATVGEFDNTATPDTLSEAEVGGFLHMLGVMKAYCEATGSTSIEFKVI